MAALFCCHATMTKAAMPENDNNMQVQGQPSKKTSCKAPAFLKKGDKVAIISPSYFLDTEYAYRAANILREWGLVPVIGPNVGKKSGINYAGTFEERLADLKWALYDPEVKAILCNRGGYSTIQMIPFLTKEVLAAHPKWLIGFSDITTLHAMEVNAGVMSIHGNMSRNIANGEGMDESSLTLRDLLFGKMPQYTLPAHPCNQQGKATAKLVGGNFCTFFPLMGSKVDYFQGGEDFILFIEEVGESYHNLDRLMNMLILNGILDRCKGVILGHFTDCKRDIDYDSVEQMFSTYFSKYDFPVVCGFPAGHESPNLPLVMGAPVTIEVTAEGARVSF